MQHFDIVREAKPKKSFRVASVMGMFDLQTDQVKEHFVGDIDIEQDGDWQIGLIVGNSGTGKTTIAKELFPDAYVTDYKYEDGWDVFVGMDFSGGDDLFAITYLAVRYNQETGNKEFFADFDAWILEAALNESPNRLLFEKWIAEGWLHLMLW